MSNSSLTPFFSPQGIAVIGASQNPVKLSYGLARNLVRSNYQGVVHFVNPKGGSLMGRPIFTNISLVPDPVDLAILLIPAPFVPQALRDCGERLNLQDEHAVSQGFEYVTRNARLSHPRAEIKGVYVQRMIPAGPEVIVGAVQDPQFGPLVMFGSGGVEVEGLNDVAFALAPLSRQEAEYLLESTWAGRKLKGYRNLPPADRSAVLDILLRLSQLAADFPQITEIEINPLRVLPDGQGAFAVDVRGILQTMDEG